MNADRRIPIVLVVVSLALMLLVPMDGRAQTEPARLNDVTVTPQADSVTVFVRTSREAQYKADLVDSPSRLVIDLEDTVYAWRKTPLVVGKDPIKQIRGSQFRQGTARVVLDLTRNVGYAIREEPNGLAIVIPTSPMLAQATPAPAAPTAPPSGAPTAPASAAPVEPAPAAAAAPVPAPLPAAPPRRVAQATPAAPPATAAPTNGQRLISFDFKDADVVNLLRILAAESNKNIVIGDDVKGKMSIALRNVPWDLALEIILETRGLRKIEKDGVMRIVSSEQLIKEREASARVEEARLKAESDVRTKAAEAQLKEQEAIDKRRAAEAAYAELQARGPLREETIRLSYADPEEIARTLQGILGIPPEGIKSQTVPAGFPPIAEPPFSALYGLQPQQLPQPLASPPSEVLAKGITIRAHKPTNSIFIRHYEADLERIKKLIRERLDVRLPQVKIEARMEILDRDDLFAIGVQWGGGGVLQSNQNTVMVGRGFTTDPTNLTTTGGIGTEGERLVIGGVTTNLDADETRKIPLFGDIPVLGWLFKTVASQTTGRELVVFITPSVLKADVAQATPPPVPVR